MRIAGPGHTPEQLARVAYRKHVRLARLEGGALGLGGVFTAAPDIVALLWIQSRMIFYIAAAYGYDPRHPMRPAELLALQGLYRTPAEARAALDGVGKRLAQAMVEQAISQPHAWTASTAGCSSTSPSGWRAATPARYIPLIGAPLGALQNAGATKEVGRLALAYYGGGARST